MKIAQLVTGVGHLGIAVSDIERTIAYYKDRLGFLLVYRKVVVDAMGSALEAVFLQLGNLVLELYRPASSGQNAVRMKPGAWDHFAIDAPDFDACVSKAVNLGMEYDASTPDGAVYYDAIGRKGVLGVNFTGPDNEVIELCHNCSVDYGAGQGLQGWSHLALKVMDLRRTIPFYERLGFTVCDDGCLETQQGTMKIVFMELGDFRLEIIEVCESMRPQLRERGQGVIGHLALEVSDVSEALCLCRQADIKVLTPVVRELSLLEHGVRYIMLEGPDHEVVELCQTLKW